MPTLKESALEFFVNEGVLTFGDFTLKSGKKSPYFFNTGRLCSGRQLHMLGVLYADMLQSIPDFDNATVVFGSAYKGIPIAVATAIALSGIRPDIRSVSDRKEAKTHGDAGSFLGVLHSGDRAVIVDDVITDGATKLESIEKLKNAGCAPLGFIIAFDRCQGEPGGVTALEAFQSSTGLRVYPLLTVHDLIASSKPDVAGKLTRYLAGE